MMVIADCCRVLLASARFIGILKPTEKQQCLFCQNPVVNEEMDKARPLVTLVLCVPSVLRRWWLGGRKGIWSH